ncbi:MAG: prephenate dehydrogenase/arogenate dehydrogenase family protein, partial [Rickettsiales bacterium]|nr:prephenate dehydrogenase/arogenate dehydrogenase family protein [Rickettsiales bacterium]
MLPIVFDRIAIIGLGLIGGSIARAVHEKRIAGHVTVCDPNEISLAYAKKHDLANAFTTSAAEAVENADFVILSAPPATLGEVAQAIAPHVKPGAVIMDVCSVKRPAIAAITEHLPQGVYFLPAHPITGSEHSGVSASRADLFERRRVVVTPEVPPSEDISDPTLDRVGAFWHALGARIEAMPPHLHDVIYAYVSHLPHLLAFAAMHVLEDYEDEREDDELLNKFLRLADSNVEMWIDIFLLNRDNVLTSLDRYLDVVKHIASELQSPPEGEAPTEADEKAARTALFPRIAASCLVTTLMEAERKAGFPFARYAGTGFADFTYPASQPPEDDIEHISKQYECV